MEDMAKTSIFACLTASANVRREDGRDVAELGGLSVDGADEKRSNSALSSDKHFHP